MGSSKKRRRTSPIFTMTSGAFQALVSRSTSIKQVLLEFGIVSSGTSYKMVKERMRQEGVDYAAFKKRMEKGKGRQKPHPLEDVLVENSSYPRGSLKRRLLKTGLLKNECAKCKVGPVWQKEPLTMVLDHINGINNDNRLENLRLLCPNCNSQTPTFAGRNAKKTKKCFFCSCGAPISRGAKHCHKCKSVYRKVQVRPNLETLLEQTSELGFRGTGNFYGVSDNAIRKWIRKAQKEQAVS